MLAHEERGQDRSGSETRRVRSLTPWRERRDRHDPTNPHGSDARARDNGSPRGELASSRPRNRETPRDGRLTDLVARLSSEFGRVFENRIANSPFFDTEGAARFLCLSKASVVYYAKRQRMLPYHVVGKTLVFHHDDLVKFMKRFRRPGVDG